MKKYTFTILTILFAFTNCFSQDVITKRTGEDIQSKILEVNTTEIKYKKFDNQNGPTYTILKSEALLIRYQNGTKDIFNEVQKSNNTTPANPLLLIKKGNKVFIEILDETSRKGEKYFIEEFKEWGYWHIVDNREAADFILGFTMEDHGWNGNTAWVTFKTKENSEFKKSSPVRSMSTAFDGYNKTKAVSKKVVKSYLKEEFK